MRMFIKVIDRSSAGKCGKINSDRDGFGAKVALGVPIKNGPIPSKRRCQGPRWFLGRDDPGAKS